MMKDVAIRKKFWLSHLLLVVAVRRLVRRCGEVGRSIALVVHHIQTTHSDRADRCGRKQKSEERSWQETAEDDSP